MSRWVYYTWEDREYRAPADNPMRMEIKIHGEWQPYRGDPARVLLEASVWDTEPR